MSPEGALALALATPILVVFVLPAIVLILAEIFPGKER